MISVIIPVYNGSASIGKCLQSVLTQSWKDIEVIVVDDGSTDDTVSVCEQYSFTDTRVRLFTKNNSGVSSARNMGLQHAQGAYCCFVDADDCLPQDALECLASALTDEFDMVIGGYEYYDDKGHIKYRVEERSVYDLNRDAAVALMYHPAPYRYLGYIWGKLFRTAIIQAHHLSFHEQICFNEDRLFITHYLCHCNRILYNTKPVYWYFEREGSAMASLEKSFNPKFATDLDAMILMKKIVSSKSPANLRNAVEGIADSYWRIQNMMNQFNANTPGRIISLHFKLSRALSFKDYFVLVLKPFFQRIIHKFLKGKHANR